MKTYLNREEQEDLIYISGFIGHLKDFVERDSKKKNPVLSSAASGWCKRIASLTYSQILKPIVSNLDQKAIQQLRRSVNNSRIICLPNERADVYLARAKKEMTEEDMIINVETFNDCIEMALYACNPCKWKTEEERKNCSGRTAFMALNVPVYDENAPAGVCPYMISEVNNDDRY